MGIVLDIILIIIVVLPIVIGLRRGMVGTLMGFISVVLALIIARVAVPYIQPVAQEKLVTVYVHEPLGEYIASELQTEGGGAVASVAELLDKLGLADLDIDGDSGNEGFAAAVTAAAESRISEGIAFLGSFLLALIAMRIITAVLEAVFRLPVLHGVNKLAGGALGALTGLGLGYAFAWVLTVMHRCVSSRSVRSSARFLASACICRAFLLMRRGERSGSCRAGAAASAYAVMR